MPTPWPSWLIAAHPERAVPADVSSFLNSLTTYVTAFDSEESRATKNVPFIIERFGYPKEDIEVSLPIALVVWVQVLIFHGLIVRLGWRRSNILKTVRRSQTKWYLTPLSGFFPRCYRNIPDYNVLQGTWTCGSTQTTWKWFWNRFLCQLKYCKVDLKKKKLDIGTNTEHRDRNACLNICVIKNGKIDESKCSCTQRPQYKMRRAKC